MKVKRDGEKVFVELWVEEAVEVADCFLNQFFLHDGSAPAALSALLEEVLVAERQQP